ncbi:MAG: DNA-directed RNA polymerase subunit omega [Desulfobulbaceae bacterium]|nr:DNA-directed RNA polymerase subunit omega [Desulfobulbaceae bacterium]
MARITVEDCLSRVGNENRFELIHLAVERVKQHRRGLPMLAKGKNKETVMTLREIASGDVTFTNIDEFNNPVVEPEVAEKETETAEAAEQEKTE